MWLLENAATSGEVACNISLKQGVVLLRRFLARVTGDLGAVFLELDGDFTNFTCFTAW
jgi:hypothetical protein